ncbi:MAG: hypothetical protein CL872_02000 [Dehalococcoidaceae bacterium]|nr:hypothetical protein [Dehalococcoidaceae bacterium]|tara:strand:+ start:2471 stop:2671 length:201 start_codon:yes stop_codon:yes gene_type:complete
MNKKAEEIDSYLEAFAYWQNAAEKLHHILFDESATKDPAKIKGALNREIRAKEKYEIARKNILGIG